MSILDNTHAIDGAQEYTLLVSTRDSNSRIICTYGTKGAILTTDYPALIEYAANLVIHFGSSHTYTIARVSSHIACNM